MYGRAGKATMPWGSWRMTTASGVGGVGQPVAAASTTVRLLQCRVQ